MSLRAAWAGTAALWLPVGLALAQAETASGDESALQQKIEEQEQRLLILERKLELQDEATKAAVTSNPVVKASGGKFSFQTPDGANVIKFRGVLHFDGRRFDDDITPEISDTWLLRRVRPTLEGTIGNIYDFRFTPDFAGGRSIILDAFVAARLRPWAVVTAGKFKVPVGLERLQSATDIRFIERAFPTSLVPNRDLGLQLSGEVAGGVVNYSVGYFNGVSDGGSSDANTPTPDAENDTKGDWAARVFFQPFINSEHFGLRGLGLGVAATYVDVTGSSATTLLPGYRTPGQQSFFSYRGNTPAAGAIPAQNNATFADGERLRVAPQLHYYIGRFGVLGEYVTVSQDVTRVNNAVTRSDSLDNTAWHAQLSWLVTGEDQSFKSVAPHTTFEPGKPGRGAFELVARYHELSIDDAAFVGEGDSFANPLTAARKARAAGVGVNWYLNQAVKWSLNYEQTRFDGGAASGDRPDEKVLLTRIGLAF